MAETITNADAQYALDIVSGSARKLDPGMPGTPQERDRAAILQAELELHLGPGNVTAKNLPWHRRPFQLRCPSALSSS